MAGLSHDGGSKGDYLRTSRVQATTQVVSQPESEPRARMAPRALRVRRRAGFRLRLRSREPVGHRTSLKRVTMCHGRPRPP